MKVNDKETLKKKSKLQSTCDSKSISVFFALSCFSFLLQSAPFKVKNKKMKNKHFATKKSQVWLLSFCFQQTWRFSYLCSCFRLSSCMLINCLINNFSFSSFFFFSASDCDIRVVILEKISFRPSCSKEEIEKKRK